MTRPGGQSAYRTDAKTAARVGRARPANYPGSQRLRTAAHGDSHTAAGPPASPTDEPPRRLDLRRRVKREEAEAILRRADLLAPADRELVEAVFGGNQRIPSLAKLRGEAPHDLRRQLRRLVARLSSREFQRVAAARDAWPPRMRAVATLCLLQGQTIDEAGRALGVTRSAVRTQLAAIRIVLNARSHRARRGPNELACESEGTGAPGAEPAVGDSAATGGGVQP